MLRDPSSNNAVVMQYLIDYCVCNNISYKKTDGFLSIFTFPHAPNCQIVYFPGNNTLFFSGLKVLEQVSIEKVRAFLDFIS